MRSAHSSLALDPNARSCVHRSVPRRLRFAPALIVFAVSCGRNGEAVAPSNTAQPATGERAVETETKSCADATCLTERSAQAHDAGKLDVATTFLGRAYATDPTDERFTAWLSALDEAGQTRDLARALREFGEAHPKAAEPFEGRNAAADGPLAPPVPGDPVALALAHERRGELEQATDGMQDVEHPAWLARKGMVLRKRGMDREAADAFARARIGVDERGGTMRLAAFETGYSTGLAWHDDHAIRITGWRPMDIHDRVTISGVEHLATGERFDVAQRLLVRSSLHMAAAQRFYGVSEWRTQKGESGFEVFDLDSGTPLGDVQANFQDYGGTRLLDDGTHRHLIETAGQDVTLWTLGPDGDDERRKLGTFRIKGSTPTITRVYTGKGTHHDNILKDEPSWPVAYAISDKAKHVAIGVSDSSVQLFDVKTGKRRMLTVDWKYTERRRMGGNPDHNRPVALAFDGDTLTVTFSRGDIVKWNSSGRKLVHNKGKCGQRDLDALSRRYGDATPLSDDEKATCGWVQRGWLSPSGKRLATTGNFDLRVLNTKTGRSVVAHTGENLGADEMAWAGESALVFSNLYGQVWQWKEGDGVVSRTETRDGMSTGPRTPRLSSDLRVLQWGGDYRPAVGWDLFTGAHLADGSSERLVMGVSASGNLAYQIQRSPEGLVVRNASGNKVYPFEQETADWVSFVSESGRHLVARRGKTHYFVDLSKALEQKLSLPVGGSSARNDTAQASADGSRVAMFGEDMTLRVFETQGGTLVAEVPIELSVEKQYRGDFRLSPDGSWIAWQEQLERPDSGLPKARIHLVGLDRGVKNRELTVEGWAHLLVPSPTGDELLVATENTITRWNLRTGQPKDEGFEYVGVNSMRYSEDGALVIFEHYNLVRIRANAPRMPVLSTIYTLDNGGWFLQTENGAVDGSQNAMESLATIVDGPLDSSVLPGEVAWDRFAVPHVLAQPRGYEAGPPGAG